MQENFCAGREMSKLSQWNKSFTTSTIFWSWFQMEGASYLRKPPVSVRTALAETPRAACWRISSRARASARLTAREMSPWCRNPEGERALSDTRRSPGSRGMWGVEQGLLRGGLWTMRRQQHTPWKPPAEPGIGLRMGQEKIGRALYRPLMIHI